MNIVELEQALLSAGCNPNNFCIGARGAQSDVYCLSENDGKWSVFYTERGSKHKPIYESRNETQACEFFYNKIMAIEHWHIVGFFERDDSARALQRELEDMGIETTRNDMPPLKAGGPNIKRVFVIGKDIFKVREIYTNLPLKDC